MKTKNLTIIFALAFIHVSISAQADFKSCSDVIKKPLFLSGLRHSNLHFHSKNQDLYRFEISLRNSKTDGRAGHDAITQVDLFRDLSRAFLAPLWDVEYFLSNRHPEFYHEMHLRVRFLKLLLDKNVVFGNELNRVEMGNLVQALSLRMLRPVRSEGYLKLTEFSFDDTPLANNPTNNLADWILGSDLSIQLIEDGTPTYASAQQSDAIFREIRTIKRAASSLGQ